MKTCNWYFVLKHCCKMIWKECSEFYHPRITPFLQQIRLLQVVWILTSDWKKLSRSHALLGSYVTSCKTSLPWAGIMPNITAQLILQQYYKTSCLFLLPVFLYVIPGSYSKTCWLPSYHLRACFSWCLSLWKRKEMIPPHFLSKKKTLPFPPFSLAHCTLLLSSSKRNQCLPSIPLLMLTVCHWMVLLCFSNNN